MANLLTRVPKRAQPGVATMVRTIYQQLSPAEDEWTEWWNNSGSPFPRWPSAGGRRADIRPTAFPVAQAEAVVQQPAGVAEPR